MTLMILKDFGLTWLDSKACRLVCRQWCLWVDKNRAQDASKQLQVVKKVLGNIRKAVTPLISQHYPLTAYDYFRTMEIRQEVKNLIRTSRLYLNLNDTFEKEEKCAAHVSALIKAAGELCLASRQSLALLLPSMQQSLPTTGRTKEKGETLPYVR